MNYLISLSFAAIILHLVNCNKEASHLKDDLARQAVEIIKEINKDGKVIHVASLDTLHFDHQHVDLCGPIICIHANVTESTLNGLASFETLKSDFVTEGSKLSMDIDINFPYLILDSEYYEMEGNIMEALPLAGHGKLHLEVKNIRLWTKIILGITEDGTTIEEFVKPGFTIQNIYSHMDFDGNIDAIFNKMVEELLVIYLNRFNKAIAVYYTLLLKELLNPIL